MVEELGVYGRDAVETGVVGLRLGYRHKTAGRAIGVGSVHGLGIEIEDGMDVSAGAATVSSVLASERSKRAAIIPERLTTGDSQALQAPSVSV